jgi:cytochrome c553
MKRLTQSAILLTMILASSSLLAAGLADGNASAGKSKAAACAACHGADGNSTSPDYPKLAGQGALYIEKELHDFKSGKRTNGIMQGMAAGLSDTDIQDIAAWFSEQKTSVDQADPKLVKQGEAIFRGGLPDKGVPACSGCHGPAGQGIISARFPKLAGQHAAYVEAQLKAFRAAGRDDLGNVVKRTNDKTGDAPGPMETIASRLSDMEIKQVASFVSGLSK